MADSVEPSAEDLAKISGLEVKAVTETPWEMLRNKHAGPKPESHVFDAPASAEPDKKIPASPKAEKRSMFGGKPKPTVAPAMKKKAPVVETAIIDEVDEAATETIEAPLSGNTALLVKRQVVAEKKAPLKKAPTKKGPPAKKSGPVVPAKRKTGNESGSKKSKKGVIDLSSRFDTFDVPGVSKEVSQSKRDKKNAKKIDVISAAKSFRQLAMMLSVDKNEISPVGRVADQYKGTPMGTVYAKMRTDMAENNMSFSSAFAKNGKVFPKVVTGLVSIGAQAGKEGDALKSAATIIQDNAKTGRRIKSAISEPIFTLVLTVMFLFVVLFGIIPQFKAVFDALGKPLPFLSQLLMNISTGTGYFLAILAVILISLRIYWVKKGQMNEDLRVKIDTWKLNMKPRVFAELIQTGLMAQVFNNLAILRGINMNERNSLITAARSTQNWAMRKHLLVHAAKMEEGEVTFGELANDVKVFPPDAGYMLMAGEDSGKGTQTLAEMAHNYREESELAADQFVAQIGPIANSAVGVVYMFVMLASYLPVFEMYTDIGTS